MHTRLVHGSTANLSGRPRTLYIVTYCAEDAQPLVTNHIPSRLTKARSYGARRPTASAPCLTRWRSRNIPRKPRSSASRRRPHRKTQITRRISSNSTWCSPCPSFPGRHTGVRGSEFVGFREAVTHSLPSFPRRRESQQQRLLQVTVVAMAYSNRPGIEPENSPGKPTGRCGLRLILVSSGFPLSRE